jgi:hypothetical protein
MDQFADYAERGLRFAEAAAGLDGAVRGAAVGTVPDAVP